MSKSNKHAKSSPAESRSESYCFSDLKSRIKSWSLVISNEACKVDRRKIVRRRIEGAFLPLSLAYFTLMALGLVVFAISAQTKATDLPEFEVASIRPVPPDGPRWGGVEVFPGGRTTLAGIPLTTLVSIAFDLSNSQISGGAAWTKQEFYTIEAIPPEHLRTVISTNHALFAIGDERLRRMLQALLISRFQLKFHYETKISRVYVLETNPKKPKMHLGLAPADGKSDAYPSGSIGFSERWVVNRTTMQEMARFISNYVMHCPVIDRTGLAGTFNYTAEEEGWETYKDDPDGSFLNLIKDMGLKLEVSKGPVEVLVIDHAEKPLAN